MPSKYFTDASRDNWFSNTTLNNDDLKLGCLQRIAAATELMAKNYQQLIDERDRYKKAKDNWMESYDRSVRRIKALRGVITKLKKQIPQKP